MSSPAPPYDTLLSIFDFLNGDLSALKAARLVCKLFDDAASTVIYETVVDDPFGSMETSVNSEKQHLVKVMIWAHKTNGDVDNVGTWDWASWIDNLKNFQHLRSFRCYLPCPSGGFQPLSLLMSTLGTLPLLEEIYLEPVWWRKAFDEFKDLRPSLRHLGCFAASDLGRIDNTLTHQLISLQLCSVSRLSLHHTKSLRKLTLGSSLERVHINSTIKVLSSLANLIDLSIHVGYSFQLLFPVEPIHTLRHFRIDCRRLPWDSSTTDILLLVSRLTEGAAIETLDLRYRLRKSEARSVYCLVKRHAANLVTFYAPWWCPSTLELQWLGTSYPRLEEITIGRNRRLNLLRASKIKNIKRLYVYRDSYSIPLLTNKDAYALLQQGWNSINTFGECQGSADDPQGGLKVWKVSWKYDPFAEEPRRVIRCDNQPVLCA